MSDVVKYKVVRYKYDKLVEMLHYNHLDYLQQRYYTKELCKLYNENIQKSIRLLELLTNNHSNTDDNGDDNKYNILGYIIENNTEKDIVETIDNKEITIQSGKKKYIHYIDNENNTFKIKYLEQLSYDERQKFIDNNEYITFKLNLDQEILRENDYNEITCY